MIKTILGLILNRRGRQGFVSKIEEGYVLADDLMRRPVIAPKQDFVEHGDKAFKPVRHDGCGLDTTVYVKGKGE